MIRKIISCLFPALACVLANALPAAAQPQEILDIAARYPGENAVMLRKSEDLVLKFDAQDRLTAVSEIEEELLLLNDLAPGIYNTTDIYHSSFHKLRFWDAASYIPAKKDYKMIKASLLKSTNLKTENIFFDDSKISVIGFSGLVKLAKVRTHYEIEHQELNFLPSFYIQDNLPVVACTYRIIAPKSVQVRTILQFVDTTLLLASVEEHKNTVIYTWKAKNTGRYKSYDNAPPFPAGRPHIIPYISAYTSPDKKTVQMISDPASLYRFIYRFIAQTNRDEVKDISTNVAELTKDCPDDRCKAEKIYRWVQDNISYVAFEDSLGGFVPREAALVYRRKYGDCKDMSSLLVMMLRAAGLKASYTWIGTRRKPYQIGDVPLPLIFNHMICAWNDDGKWVFLDGTHSTIRFGVPPYSLQGKDALISIDEKQFEIVRVPVIDASQNRSIDSTWITINKDDELEGRLKIQFSGYAEWAMKSLMRYSNRQETEKTIKSLSSRASNKFFQKSGRFESLDKEICFYSEFGVKDYVQRIGKELYINMNLQRYNSGQKIDDVGVRKLPVENDYKKMVSEVICLDIPDGYEVSYLPKDATHSIEGVWSYSVKYLQKGKQIICIKEFVEPELYIAPALFNQNNLLTQELNDHYKETVVLRAL